MTAWENCMKDTKVLLSMGFSIIGLFLNFIALCILQGQIVVPTGTPNPVGLFWFFFFFYCLTVGSAIGSYATASTHNYRIVLSSMIAVCLAYVPININTFLTYASFSATSNSGNLAVAGLIIFAITGLFPLLVWIGCDEDTPLNRFTAGQIKLGEGRADERPAVIRV